MKLIIFITFSKTFGVFNLLFTITSILTVYFFYYTRGLNSIHSRRIASLGCTPVCFIFYLRISTAKLVVAKSYRNNKISLSRHRKFADTVSKKKWGKLLEFGAMFRYIFIKYKLNYLIVFLSIMIYIVNSIVHSSCVELETDDAM